MVMAVVMEQEMVVVPEQDQPAGALEETKVTPVGRVSDEDAGGDGSSGLAEILDRDGVGEIGRDEDGRGGNRLETAKSEVVVGSTMMEVMLVLLAGTVSTRAEFVTVAEFWMVVPAAVLAVTSKVMVRVLAVAPLASVVLKVQTMGPTLLRRRDSCKSNWCRYKPR